MLNGLSQVYCINQKVESITKDLAGMAVLDDYFLATNYQMDHFLREPVFGVSD